jgi:hypothetical protein
MRLFARREVVLMPLLFCLFVILSMTKPVAPESSDIPNLSISQQFQWAKPTMGIIFGIQEEALYKLGHPMMIKTALRNSSDREIVVGTLNVYRFKLRNRSGQTVNSPPKYVTGFRFSALNNGTKVLKPGQTLIRTIDLANYFTVPSAGTYVVTITRSLSPGVRDDAPRTSETFMIRVK